MKNKNLSLVFVGYLLISCFSLPTLAEVFIRYNQAGYSAMRSKHIIVMANKEQNKATWQLKNSSTEIISSGLLGASIAAKTDHSAKPYNYLIDISNVTKLDDYQLVVTYADQESNEQTITKEIVIKAQPYQAIGSDILRFLRVARSGTADTLLTPASHLADDSAVLYEPLGDIKQGQWQQAQPLNTVDMLGGWYDAADYIKFTLTTAYTSYYLLRSYQEAPDFFQGTLSKRFSQTKFIDVLDEAKIGLDYLLKTQPSVDEFIIQVSTGKDHQQGYRLPQDDSRDGQREALSAISPSHMGLTSAALALGSKIFAKQNELALSEKYKKAAIAIFQRATQDDALVSPAFERDATNDFYLDNNSADNMGLAAIELYLLTTDEKYLMQAQHYAKQAHNGKWASWCCVTSSLNYRLSLLSDDANRNFTAELNGYQQYDRQQGNIWGIPMIPTWGPLAGAGIAASYGGLKYLQEQTNKSAVNNTSSNEVDARLLWDNIDYFFGRNNWGISFVASRDLDFAVENIYSQVYQLTETFPLGAVSEGPGKRSTYLQLQDYFTPTLLDDSFEEFNTSTQVFFDNSSNFQTMESTIVGQAATLYMLAVASKVQSSTDITVLSPEIPQKNIPEMGNHKKSNNNKTSSGGSFQLSCIAVLLLLFIFRRYISRQEVEVIH